MQSILVPPANQVCLVSLKTDTISMNEILTDMAASMLLLPFMEASYVLPELKRSHINDVLHHAVIIELTYTDLLSMCFMDDAATKDSLQHLLMPSASKPSSRHAPANE